MKGGMRAVLLSMACDPKLCHAVFIRMWNGGCGVRNLPCTCLTLDLWSIRQAKGPQPQPLGCDQLVYRPFAIRLDLLGYGHDMAVRIEAIAGTVPPIPFDKRAEHCCPGFECSSKHGLGLMPDQVQLRPRNTACRAWVWHGRTQQFGNPLAGHQTQYTTSRKIELRHARNIENGLDPQDEGIEKTASRLVFCEEDEMGSVHSSMIPSIVP